MKNMISKNRITEIKIGRFRSIDDLTIELGRLTTLVGHNDAGKSNIARALNLFFNNETSPGVKFDFESDFNKFSKIPQKKAKEINIEITFELPQSYSKKREWDTVKWQKTWRSEGLLPEEKSDICYTNGDQLEKHGRIRMLLNRYSLIYVPAIKDATFFTDLLGKIYDVLALSGNDMLKESGKEFNTAIQKSTQKLLDDLAQSIGEDDNFSITLPDDLRPIFENLKIKNKENIPFERRGDGIKIRHIPEMLNFITLQKENAHKGAVAPHHIWVFEEPENNLEFFAARNMTKRLEEILHIRTNTQILITTHSPVFYGMSLLKRYGTKKHFVKKFENFTIREPANNKEHLDKVMGLMPLVGDYIRVYIEREKDLEEQIEKLKLANKLDFTSPTIFVEGKTDKKIIKKALAIFFPNEDIKVYSCHQGGADTAAYALLAWEYLQRGTQNNVRTRSIVLLDDDSAGRNAIGKINNGTNNYQYIKWQFISARGTTVKNLKSKNYNITPDLESLYSDNFWRRAEEKKWLTKTETLDDILPRKDRNRLLIGIVDQQPEHENPLDNLSEDERLRVRYKFSVEGKMAAAKYINNQSDANAKEVLENFHAELQTIIAYIKTDILL